MQSPLWYPTAQQPPLRAKSLILRRMRRWCGRCVLENGALCTFSRDRPASCPERSCIGWRYSCWNLVGNTHNPSPRDQAMNECAFVLDGCHIRIGKKITTQGAELTKKRRLSRSQRPPDWREVRVGLAPGGARQSTHWFGGGRKRDRATFPRSA